MRKLKILSSVTLIAGFFLLSVGCSKSSNSSSTSSSTDSVFYSPWIKLQMSTVGDTVYYEDLTASKLTQNILSTGVVLGYLGSPNASAGDTSVNNALDYGLYQVLSVGKIEVQSYGYLNDLSFTNSGLLYRYVVIPGTALTTTSLHNLTQQQLNKMSIKEISKALSTPAASDSSRRLSAPN